jgi:hypothetical protein
MPSHPRLRPLLFVAELLKPRASAVGLISKSKYVSEGLHDNALASASGLTRVLAPLHLPNDKLKSFEHILVVAGTGFGPRALELFGQGFAVFGGDLTLFGTEVGFVAYNDDGDPVDGLCGLSESVHLGNLLEWPETHEVVEDLITDDARHFKALLASNRVDNHVAMNANKVLRVKDTILILERRIVLVGISTNL